MRKSGGIHRVNSPKATKHADPLPSGSGHTRVHQNGFQKPIIAVIVGAVTGVVKMERAGSSNPRSRRLRRPNPLGPKSAKEKGLSPLVRSGPNDGGGTSGDETTDDPAEKKKNISHLISFSLRATLILVAFSSFACLQVHGESTDEGVSVLVQQDKREPNLERRSCGRGTWGVRRRKKIRVSRSAEVGLGFGPIGPSEIGLGFIGLVCKIGIWALGVFVNGLLKIGL
ncbi:hypothetical protein CXB51_009509 [Gossypium anomalum]|uniref:Transmembrane protein n=1 Tax=Gossypium anomalum TaxID=47600 RepID=A0A8J5YT82_9ROSI|nr:hypothetical protein CXB51_009509 [Gossypium anomalum]